MSEPDPSSPDAVAGTASRLRRVVLIVAGLNFAYFFVEFTVALTAGSVSLLADSVDFLEDTSVNLLIFIALGWPMVHRSVMGKVMAALILGPAVLAGWQAIERFGHPTPCLLYTSPSPRDRTRSRMPSSA
jgi:Co/Zn/Cd efflux system component